MIDIRGHFATHTDLSGRRETSMDVRWDTNRNPFQKIILKTIYEPWTSHENDWNGTMHFSYPGTTIDGNWVSALQGTKLA